MSQNSSNFYTAQYKEKLHIVPCKEKLHIAQKGSRLKLLITHRFILRKTQLTDSSQSDSKYSLIYIDQSNLVLFCCFKKVSRISLVLKLFPEIFSS